MSFPQFRHVALVMLLIATTSSLLVHGQQCGSANCNSNGDCKTGCPCMPSEGRIHPSNATTAAVSQLLRSASSGGQCGDWMGWCGSLCHHDDDCPSEQGGTTECTSCVKGVCAKPVCGSKCMFSSDCPSSCGECAGAPTGVCRTPGAHNRTCGVECSSDDQCAQNDGCNVCRNGICDSPPDPTCNAPCNSHGDCNDSTCNYCDEGTCTVYLKVAEKKKNETQAASMCNRPCRLHDDCGEGNCNYCTSSGICNVYLKQDDGCGQEMKSCAGNYKCTFRSASTNRCLTYGDWLQEEMVTLFGHKTPRTHHVIR